MNGLYSIILRTPLGAKKGSFDCQTVGNQLSGTLSFKDKSEVVNDGYVENQSFTFSGNLQTPKGLIRYQAKGTFDDKSLRGELETGKGTFTFTGTKK